MAITFEILDQHGLRKTAFRAKVLDLFLENSKALTLDDLEEGLGEFDRITLYRCLKSFETSGIVHKVYAPNGTQAYARSPQQRTDGQRDHVHFVCSDCNDIVCLNEFDPVKVILPSGYKAEQQHVMVTGLCNKCNKNNN